MEPFDPGMFPHRVKVQALAEDTDLAGGLEELFPDLSGLTAVPCRVRLRGSVPGMVAGRYVAVTLVDIAFPVDPQCRKGWAFYQALGNRIFRALGPAQARDADGVLFVVSCEARDD